MERNLKQCRIIIEPINLENNVTTKPTAPNCQRNSLNRNDGTPRHIKFETLKDSSLDKNSTSNLPEESEFLTPCFNKLENKKVIKKCRNSFNTMSTPQCSLKLKKLPPEMQIEKIQDKASAPFEPVTPKANIEFSLELKRTLNERNILTSNTKTRVFEALDEIKNKTEEERRSFKREKALLEIINSEIKYVHQLEIIINFFMKPTKERNLLKPDDYDILFRNINTIYNINKELLDELDKGERNVANAFSKIAPFLKLYSMYAYEFKSTLSLLQNARLFHPQFAKFLENQESRPEVQKKLSALLIAPIQRVPRYKLLLTNVYNLTKPSEEGFNKLSDCLEKIERVAQHINQVMEEQENAQRLLEVQRCLCGGPNVITPGRKLIKEGTLTKMSTKNAHSEKLHVILMNDIIMFTKMKKDEPKVNSLKCKSIFPLNKCKIIEILDKGCLRITCQEEELILYHDQFSETVTWIEKIKETIDNHLKDRKTLRKESSARRPVKRKDLYEYHEIGLSPGRPLKKRRFDEEASSVSTPSHRVLGRPPIQRNFKENKDLLSLSTISEPVKNTTSNEIIKKEEQAMEIAKDVFVFGKSNDERGFKFGKLIGNVGSTIKRIFGFRN